MNIPERMNHYNVPGVSITYFTDGEVAWSKYFGALDKNTDRDVNDGSIFHACSISKMVTALCVLRLAQDGIIDLYRDVNEYLTSWKISDNEFTAKKKITLANLLAHQAGLYDCDGSFGPYCDGDTIPATIDILRGTSRYNHEEVRAKYAPETDFAYSDAGYCIISQVVEDVVGETIPQIAKRLIFEPLELTSTFFWEAGKESYDGISMSDCAVGHGSNGEVVEQIRASYPNIEGAGLWTTTNELVCIVIDIIKAYNGQGGVVLNRQMAGLMLTPYGCVDYAGMGIFLGKDERGEPCFISQGWGVGMQCKLRVYYEQQDGVIVMTNSDPGIEQNKALIGEIIEFVCKK